MGKEYGYYSLMISPSMSEGIVGQINMFHFNLCHLDSPRVSLQVQNTLQLCIYLVSFWQEFIQFHLPANTSQGGLGQLWGGKEVILYLYYGVVGIHDPEVDDRIYLYGNIIPCNDVLGGTSIATRRRVTLTILSMIGMRIIKPGPLVLITRPRRKITPRSYSLKIQMADVRKKTISTNATI